MLSQSTLHRRLRLGNLAIETTLIIILVSFTLYWVDEEKWAWTHSSCGSITETRMSGILSQL